MISLLSFIDESFIGWVIWVAACGWTVLTLVVHLIEIFRPNPFIQPKGFRVLLPVSVKRLITAVYVLGATVVLYLTLMLGISKFHLLWFFPLWHYFGTPWIALLYERTALASRNLESAIDRLADLFIPSDRVEDLRKWYISCLENFIHDGFPSGLASDLSYRYVFISYMDALLGVIEKSGEVQELQNLLSLVEDVYKCAPKLGVLGRRHRNTRKLLKYVLQKVYNRLDVIQKTVASM